MRTIAIFNQKGGVGKTITAATMAHVAAKHHGKRVLLGDCDGQGNLSQYYGVGTEDLTTMLDVLQGKADSFYENIVTDAAPGVDIIPADTRLLLADLQAIKDGERNLGALEDLRLALVEDDAYDLFILDCPTGLTTASAAALVAADDVIIPIRMDAFSTNGMAVLMMLVAQMRALNPRLRVAGILPTHYRNTPEEQQAITLLKEKFGLPVFTAPIHMSAAVSESTYSGKQLVDYSPKAWASRGYKLFVAEYLSQMGGAVHG